MTIKKSILKLLFLSLLIVFMSCKKDNPEPTTNNTNNNSTNTSNGTLEAYFKGTVGNSSFDNTNGSNGYEYISLNAAGPGATAGSEYITYTSSVQKDKTPYVQLNFGSYYSTDGDDRDELKTLFAKGTYTLGNEASAYAGSYSIIYDDGTDSYTSSSLDTYSIIISESTDLGKIIIPYFGGFIKDTTNAIRIKGTIPEVKVYHIDFMSGDTLGTKTLKNISFSTVMTSMFDEK